MGAVTGTVDASADAVRVLGDAAASTLGASCRLTGALVRGLGSGVSQLGETSVVESGPLAGPSRVVGGVYRLLGATLTGVGNATVLVGGVVESVAGEASKVVEDTARVLGEPSRWAADRLRGEPSRPRRQGQRKEGRARGASPGHSATPQGQSQRRLHHRRSPGQSMAGVLGAPAVRAVSVSVPLATAILLSWALGRAAREPSEAAQAQDPAQGWPRARLQHRAGRWAMRSLIVVAVLLVLRVDDRALQRQLGWDGAARRLSTDEVESARWLNAGLAAVWSPLSATLMEGSPEGLFHGPAVAAFVNSTNTSVGGSGLGAELAMYAAWSLHGSGEVLNVAVERSAFGDSPPVLDAIRAPSDRTARLLADALDEAYQNLSVEGPRSQTARTVLLEADVTWVADAGFEMVVSTGASSASRTDVLPSLRIRLADVVLGPAPVAILVEAAPRGYPYVGFVALTFVEPPPVDFSISPVGRIAGTVTPLLRESLLSSINGLWPLADKEDVFVYNLGEYLYPESRGAAAASAEPPPGEESQGTKGAWAPPAGGGPGCRGRVGRRAVASRMVAARRVPAFGRRSSLEWTRSEPAWTPRKAA
ncbi:unnamed protein product, partial [Prorocentrum cordatum]